MCTVSYLPIHNGAIITSNRDEKIGRSLALPPQWYVINGEKVLFPKDPDAEGTWIAMKPSGQMAVLLNGGWQKHQPVYPYRKSRGLVFLDIVSANDMFGGFRQADLHLIEPFTILLFQDGKLEENRWDGNMKSSRFMDTTVPHIWSSVTLYSEDIIEQRRGWFSEWLELNPQPTSESIRQFHLFGGKGDEENGIRMNRNNEMLTVSVTCMEKINNKARMHYTDLLLDAHYETQVNLNTVHENIS